MSQGQGYLLGSDSGSMDPRVALVGAEKFWERVIVAGSGCWLWDGAFNNGGYGTFTVRSGTACVGAHRIGYELYVGPIPEGLVLDHLCRVRSCVRPDHLEPVTPAENVRRGRAADVATANALTRTHCRRGHALTEDNVVVYLCGDGKDHRYCLMCKRLNRPAVKAGRVPAVAS